MCVHSFLAEYGLLLFIFFLFAYGTTHFVSNDALFLPKMHVMAILVLVSTLCAVLLFSSSSELFAVHSGYVYSYHSDYNTVVECFILCVSILIFIFTYSYNRFIGVLSFEYYIIMLCCICSFCFFVHSNNIVFMYVLIELQSIGSYVLTSLNKHNRYSIEAGLKYFILGSFSSILLLFGFSFVYGFSGFIYLSDLSSYVRYVYSIEDDFFMYCLMLCLIFLNVGFLFKIYASPFHFWVSDIYQGAPTSVTMFLSTVPVFSYIFIYIKMYVLIFAEMFSFYNVFLSAVAICSLLSGVFGAIIQRKIKKLIAYSSVSTVGYILASLSGDNVLMVQQSIFYLLIYILNVLPIFTIILNYRTDNKNCLDNVRSLSSLFQQNKMLFFILFSFFLSLAGVPPFSGFASKLSLFTALGSDGLYLLFFFCICAAIISCYYYLRVAKFIFYDISVSSFFLSTMPYNAAFAAASFFLFNCLCLLQSSVIENIALYISLSLYLSI